MRGRNRFVGNDRRNLFRSLDRAHTRVNPKSVEHEALLPAARGNRGRIIFVKAPTAGLYVSDGTSWSAL